MKLTLSGKEFTLRCDMRALAAAKREAGIDIGKLDSTNKSPGSNVKSPITDLKDLNKLDYLLNRDPMLEFFQLTCQCIKMNSPQMNTICTIDTTQLYQRAQKLNIPYNKWQTWIEDQINKEFFRIILMRSQQKKQSQKSAGSGGTGAEVSGLNRINMRRNRQ